MATTLASPPPVDDETGGAPVVEQPLPSEPPSFGKNNRKLPDELKDALKDIVMSFQEEDKYDRRIEDINDRLMRCYDDGEQHVFFNYGTGAYQIGSAGAYVNIGDGEGFECSEYLGSYNIFRARRRTIDSVLTQNPPGIIFEPVKPDRSEDIEASETAEGYRHLFDQMNDVNDIQQAVTRYFELCGRTVAWTYTKTNAQKWGYNEEGKPRQMETVWIGGVLETSVPIISARCQEDALFCFLYLDRHYLQARSENSWLCSEDRVWKFSGGESGPGESDWKRYSRLGVKETNKGAQRVASYLSNVVTETHCFMRPAAFMGENCESPYTGPSGWDEEDEDYITEAATNDDGSPMTTGDMLRKLYPEGVHVVFVGKTYSESMPESMDDSIDIVMSEKRDSMTGGALMEPMKIVQDGFNDFKNAEREYCEKGWPMTHFRGNDQDYDAIIDQQSRPAQFNLIKEPLGPADEPLANNFYQEPPLNIPASFQNTMEEYRGPLSQDITGASPALEGVAGPHDETASQRAMDKAQSTGILGPTWSRVQRIFAGIYKKAALKASKNPDHAKEITVTVGEGQTTVIKLERLSRGNFHAKPDNDSTFPDSTAAQRANLDTTLPQLAVSPLGIEFFQSPDNWEEVLRVKGMSDFTLTPALAYKKQTREIEILARETPQVNPAYATYNEQHAAIALQGMGQGLPAPPYTPPSPEFPSIRPGKFDYHKWEYARCQEWLSSDDRWRLEVEGNGPEPPSPNPSPMPGYSDNPHVRNVELHAEMHQAMMAQQAALQAAMNPPALPMPKPGGNPQASQAAPAVQQGSQPPGAPGQPTT